MKMEFKYRQLLVFGYFLGMAVIIKGFLSLPEFNNVNPFIFAGIIFVMGLVTLRWDWGIIPYTLRRGLGLKEIE